MVRWIFVLSLIFASPVRAAIALPGDFSAHYVVKKGFIHLGTARRTLIKEHDHSWRYESETTSAGGILGAIFKFHEVKTSRMELRDGALLVVNYQHKREGNKHIALEHLYAWDKNKVTTHWDDGETVVYDLVPGALDQNMYQLSLMLDLRQGKTVMDYTLAENRRLKKYQISLARREKIKTVLGEFNTYVVVNRDNGAETMMWCAEEYAYLPLRIEYEDNGLRITAEISQVEGLRP